MPNDCHAWPPCPFTNTIPGPSASSVGLRSTRRLVVQGESDGPDPTRKPFKLSSCSSACFFSASDLAFDRCEDEGLSGEGGAPPSGGGSTPTHWPSRSARLGARWSSGRPELLRPPELGLVVAACSITMAGPDRWSAGLGVRRGLWRAVGDGVWSPTAEGDRKTPWLQLEIGLSGVRGEFVALKGITRGASSLTMTAVPWRWSAGLMLPDLADWRGGLCSSTTRCPTRLSAGLLLLLLLELGRT